MSSVAEDMHFTGIGPAAAVSRRVVKSSVTFTDRAGDTRMTGLACWMLEVCASPFFLGERCAGIASLLALRNARSRGQGAKRAQRG
jgi:hypothetical protein